MTSGYSDRSAHVQRRAGATVLGAALRPDGSGDIAISDVVGGTGVLRIAPFDGEELVAAFDVTSTPHWMPDGTIVVLARVDGRTALVAVDPGTAAGTVLVADAGTGGADARISSDASGTFVAWVTATEVRVLDSRDGSVVVTAAPQGFVVTGGPAVRP